MQLGLTCDREELNALGFPVVVENWHHVVGVGSSGSKRRKYHAEFTENERRTIARYKDKFYRWYLVKGTPASFTFGKIETYHLLQRACNFFATV
jgi:hypothetical protein